MPLTALGFTVCALAISGVWPLNGFVSKEMVFHGALRDRLHRLRHRRLARGHLHLRLVPQGRPLRSSSASAAARSPPVKESQPAHHLPHPGPGRPVHPVRRLQQAAPDAVHPAHPRAGHVEAGEHLDFTSHALAVFNPIALISIGCLRPGLRACTATAS
ncbi:MAG: hypothetical protein MZU95_12995 [Desulfomicrobium escambiense]|nr:hypothetical protein [Desulfomicrobium escambiense]